MSVLWHECRLQARSVCFLTVWGFFILFFAQKKRDRGEGKGPGADPGNEEVKGHGPVQKNKNCPFHKEIPFTTEGTEKKLKFQNQNKIFLIKKSEKKI